MNIVTNNNDGFIPVEVLGTMSEMYETGKSYEVIVEDRMHPDAKLFAFGINGRLGEYPTKTKICLKGEEIQHLYNCQFEQPVIEESGPDKYRKVTGRRMVCRFAITPTTWGSLPERAVLLDKSGTRKDSNTVPIIKETPVEEIETIQENKMGTDITANDMMAAREKELADMDWADLQAEAKSRGTRQTGKKSEIIDAILKAEEAVLKGE